MVSVYYPGDMGLCSRPSPLPMQQRHASPLLSQLLSYKKFLNESLSFPPFTTDAQCPARHWRYGGRQRRRSPAFGEPRSLRKTNTNRKREQKQRTRNTQGDRLLSSEDQHICGNRGRLLRRDLEDPSG